MSNIFGERLKKERLAKGLSQTDLGLATNTSYRTIQSYESENRNPGLNILVSISKILNISIDYLAGLTDEPNALATTTVIEKKIELPDEEAAMLDAFRKCSSEAQIYLLNKAKVMAYEEQHKSMDEEAATGEEDAALLA